jgi:hypothetical protein
MLASWQFRTTDSPSAQTNPGGPSQGVETFSFAPSPRGSLGTSATASGTREPRSSRRGAQIERAKSELDRALIGRWLLNPSGTWDLVWSWFFGNGCSRFQRLSRELSAGNVEPSEVIVLGERDRPIRD